MKSALSLWVILLSAWSSFSQVSPHQEERTRAPGQATPQNINTITFKPYTYFDKAAGINDFSLLIPSGWQFEGGIKWVCQHPLLPAYTDFKVKSPDGKRGCERFHGMPFIWSDNPRLIDNKAAGDSYGPGKVEVRPWEPDVVKALKSIVLTKHRRDYAELKIIEGEQIAALRACFENALM